MPEIRLLPNQKAREMGNLLTRRRQLIEMLTVEHNRLLQADEGIRPSIEVHIKWLEKALSDINDYLDRRIRSSPSWREKDNLLNSLPGIGKVVSSTLLIELPELRKLLTILNAMIRSKTFWSSDNIMQRVTAEGK